MTSIRLCDIVHRQTEFNKKKSEVKRVKYEIEFISVLYKATKLNFVVLAWEYIYPHFWLTG